MMTAMILMLVAGSPASAKCCSVGGGGGGASFDFLGDSSMDISMDSYDEFLRDNVAESSVSTIPVSNANSTSESRMELNLSDLSRIDLQLSVTEDSLTGRGDLTRSNETKTIEAVGRLQANTLWLNVKVIRD
jgi:hypothetical protein